VFNFFKKQPKEQPKEEPIEEHILLPSITSDEVDCSLIYYIKKDGEICLDVDIDSHNESTIANLAKLTTAVATEACQVETLNMIKEGLVAEGKPESFTLLVIHLAEALSLSEKEFENTGERPCIRPSDMI